MRRVTKRQAAKQRRGCEGKQRHDSETAAAAHAIGLRKQGARVSYYACPICQGWHVGHTPKSVRQSIRARNP